MADPARPLRPRPPALRIALIAALCGATVGLLRIGERQASPLLPSALEAAGDAVVAVDMRYRIALFAQDLARRCGVPAVAAPSTWEEQAVAEYERLALVPAPDPLACHRLGIIYARRGYLRQAREMLMRAASGDEPAGDVYWALLLVYSEDRIKADQVAKLRASLTRQPRWLAMLTMGDLARRLDLERLGRHFERRGRQEVWRFGLAMTAIATTVFVSMATSLVVVALLGIGALFRRGRVAPIWPPVLPLLRWVDILDVAAVAMFCNALGQVARDSLAASITPGSALDLGLRLAHAAFAMGPALVLVLGRARSSPFGCRRALGLRSRGAGRHLFQAVVGLGVVLAGTLIVRDMLLDTLRFALPGIMPAAMPAGGSQTAWALGGPCFWGDLLLVILIAPVVEEVIFRGFVFQSVLLRMRPAGAAVISAALFAGAHLAWEPSTFLSLFFLGVVSAYVYRVSQSLVPSILLHIGYNAIVLATATVIRM